MDISLRAKNYINDLAKNGGLFDIFLKEGDLIPFAYPTTFFMAGSPGYSYVDFDYNVQTLYKIIENVNI
jgi:hypothetical protein